MALTAYLRKIGSSISLSDTVDGDVVAYFPSDKAAFGVDDVVMVGIIKKYQDQDSIVYPGVKGVLTRKTLSVTSELRALNRIVDIDHEEQLNNKMIATELWIALSKAIAAAKDANKELDERHSVVDFSRADGAGFKDFSFENKKGLLVDTAGGYLLSYHALQDLNPIIGNGPVRALLVRDVHGA